MLREFHCSWYRVGTRGTRVNGSAVAGGVCALLVLFLPLRAQEEETPPIADITGRYEFLTADDHLALLEEEGKLRGYVDVLQGEEESDAILSYPITIGWRKKNQVEFKTGKIHQKYFRFAGTVQRGRGHQEGERDYLRLVGSLEVVTVKGDTGEEVPQRFHVVLKSLGRIETEEEK
jgi:hypothetical protein